MPEGQKICAYAPKISLLQCLYSLRGLYERQLRRHIYPALSGINVEDIVPADIQRIFNGMDGAKETKIKVKNVLNMILEQAVDDRLIQRNPLHSRSIRITGRNSRPTEPYSVEQMRILMHKVSEKFKRCRTGLIWRCRRFIHCGWRKCWG